MNDVIKTIKERRSVRKFKPDMVPKDIINEIIEAGLYAPSGMGKQATKIIAVTNKELRDKISEMNRTIGGWKEGFDPFYGAPVILIVLADKNRATNVYDDGSLVMENLMLAAHTLGIGSCWIHRAEEEFSVNFGKNILKDLSIDGEWVGVAHCALGYIDGEPPKAHPIKTDRVYWID